jgi:hypothetical protein
MKILAIDPGNNESAYVLMDNYKPIEFGKVANYDMLEYISDIDLDTKAVVIEMIASYGMAVGKEVFETCVWIGRFYETARSTECRYIEYIYRKDVKMNLCGQTKAKDSNIRQALIDRFGVVGVKKSPGWFYGFKADIWAAYAVGVTYLDGLKEGTK